MGAAVGTFDDGGDAFAQVVFGCGHVEDVAAAVGVDVDEAGGADQTARVDSYGRGGVGDEADSGDGVAPDADLAVEPGAARAIDYLGIGDQDVEGVGLGGKGEGGQ